MSDIDATDAAADLAAEHGLDLAKVEGTGAGGRITKGDVEAALKAAEPKGEPAADENDDPDLDEELDGQAEEDDEDEANDLHDEPGPHRPVMEEFSRTGAAEADQFGPADLEAQLGQPPAESDDATPLAIQAATTLQQLLTMTIDRKRYAAHLHRRAREILEGKGRA